MPRMPKIVKHLLRRGQGAQPSEETHTPVTEQDEPPARLPLHKHIEMRADAHTFSALLDDYNIEETDPLTGHTALHVLLDPETPYSRPDLEILRMLLEAGANINALDKHGNTPLYYAIINGYVDAVKLILELCPNIDTDIKFIEGNSLLHVASEIKHHGNEMVKLLIEYGFDKESRNRRGFTPIVTALYTINPPTIEALLEAGVNLYTTVGAPPNNAFDLLYGYLDVLVKAGFNINIRFRPHSIQPLNTFLGHAIESPHLELDPREILKHHPDVNIASETGMTPLASAVEQHATCEDDKTKRVKKEVIVRLLNQPGIDVDEAPDHEISPLAIAARHGDYSAVEMLLILAEPKPNINKHSSYGHSALCAATSNSHHEIGELLRAHGAADINTSVKHSPAVCGQKVRVMIPEGFRGL